MRAMLAASSRMLVARGGRLQPPRLSLPPFPPHTRASSHQPYVPPNPEPNVVYSPIAPVELPTQDLPNLMYSRMQQWRHLDATECSVTGRKYSYGEVLDKGLRWGGVVGSVLPPSSPSRTLAICCTNAPEFPILLLGTLAAGATISTINASYTAMEVAEQLGHSDAAAVVTDPHLEGMMGEALALLGKKLPVFVNGASSKGHPNVRDLLEDPARPFCDLAESPTESMAVMPFSSGTTGKPKGVVLSHRAITSNLATFTHPFFFPYQPPADGYQDTITGVLPFHHVYGMYVVNLLSLYLGAKIVTFPAFDPVNFIKVIKKHKVRVIHLVPPMLNFMAASDQVTSADLESVRSAMCAAAPVPSTAARMFKDKAPHPVLFQEGFGMTETLGTHMTPMNDERLGYCGKVAVGVEAKVVDDTGMALPEGQRGELCVRSPSLMTCYYKSPAATELTLDQEGWLHTGDVAVHQDGFFSIVDRIKELIKVKGFQVSPSELEDVLLQHPGVMDAAVIGVPDTRAGEVPRAYIIRKSPSHTEEDIQSFLSTRLADFKQLRGGVRFVDTLPKNPTGKVLKRELIAMAAKDI